MWLKTLLNDFSFDRKTIRIYCDNESTIYLSKSHQFHNKIKHIDIKYHFVGQKVEGGEMEIVKLNSYLW